MQRGTLFVISGPSGVGKGTLVARLVQRVPDAWLSISATTRPPREGERDGVHYRFMSTHDFETLVAKDGFLEWAQYGENYYGTPRQPVEEQLSRGRHVFLEIEVQGAFQVKERMCAAHLIFVEPPSLDELKRRLYKRGTDSPEAIERRLATAQLELKRAKDYDCRVVNDDLDQATEQLLAYIENTVDQRSA